MCPDCRKWGSFSVCSGEPSFDFLSKYLGSQSGWSFRHCLMLCMKTVGVRALWSLHQRWRVWATKQVGISTLIPNLQQIALYFCWCHSNFFEKGPDFFTDPVTPAVIIKQIPVLLLITRPKNSHRKLVCLLLSEMFY